MPNFFVTLNPEKTAVTWAGTTQPGDGNNWLEIPYELYQEVIASRVKVESEVSEISITNLKAFHPSNFSTPGSKKAEETSISVEDRPKVPLKTVRIETITYGFDVAKLIDLRTPDFKGFIKHYLESSIDDDLDTLASNSDAKAAADGDKGHAVRRLGILTALITSMSANNFDVAVVQQAFASFVGSLVIEIDTELLAELQTLIDLHSLPFSVLPTN